MEVTRIADVVGIDSTVRDATFENTLLVGPAVLAPIGNVTISDCSFGGDPGAPDALFIEVPEGKRVMGVVALVNVTFRRCRFENVALLATRDNIDRWRQTITPGPAGDRPLTESQLMEGAPTPPPPVEPVG